MPETEDQEYRRINLEFLNGNRNDFFDIFYRSQGHGSTRFVKFASSHRQHQERVQRLLESGEPVDEFFIREKDLLKYYEHATDTLRHLVNDPGVSITQKTQKIYHVSKGIMKEFFEHNCSPKILVTVDEVVEIMEDCFKQSEVGFYGISQITSKDYYTYTHSVNVSLYCMTFGIKKDLNRTLARQLGLGGLLHDVGKSRVSMQIINKASKLTQDEFESVKAHAPLGEDILKDMRCYGPAVVDMAGQHHEQFKGGGYPRGLEGEEISLYARICKVMDVYDALTSRRPYKAALAPFDALILMHKEMSGHFDPKILKDFITLMGPDM